jgi:hypothetical protein
MDDSPSSADLELLLREIQVLEEENFVLTDSQESIEASITSPKSHSEQGDLNAPSGPKVPLINLLSHNFFASDNTFVCLSRSAGNRRS